MGRQYQRTPHVYIDTYTLYIMHIAYNHILVCCNQALCTSEYRFVVTFYDLLGQILYLQNIGSLSVSI